MGAVKLLPELVINQIAAGEVVDRPASVVRELVDNSIDAGAHIITVELDQGGHDRIRILDDGCGMERGDLELAFTRHATSKISSLEDLHSLSSLGFRGEALPSIASIAHVTVRTRPRSSDMGHQMILEGGDVLSTKPCAAPPGTDIQISRLFFNTPARRKFLRQPRTELTKIKSWIYASSFGNPKVRYHLIADGSEAITLPSRENIFQRARDIIDGTSVEVNGSYERIHVTGVVAHPSLAQSDAGALAVLVNGRLISDKMILRAVKEGFDSTLKDREVPRGVISVSLDPAAVDVNVHPQKSEVRFAQSSDVFVAVRRAVREAVAQFTTPVFSSGAPLSSFKGSQASAPRYFTSSEASTFFARDNPPSPSSGAENPYPDSTPIVDQAPLPAPSFQADFHYSEISVIGQALGCYIIGECRGQLIVLDMHAAHERISFNRIREALTTQQLPGQQLAIPLSVALSQDGVARCESLAPVLARLGIIVEPFGDTTLLIRESPTLFRVEQLTAIVKDIATLESDATEAIVRGSLQEHIDHIAARLACHGSVRSGDLLSLEEMRALLKDLDAAEMASACPHGRPVIVSYTRDDIDQWFGRDR